MRIATACLFGACILNGCVNEELREPEIDGDRRRGAETIARLECGACHVIPGVPHAWGQVGPPLNEWAQHAYIAGKFPNTPQYMIRWLMDPPALAPETGMPAVPMTETEARDLAAFLYELR
jgi:cytochrome c